MSRVRWVDLDPDTYEDMVAVALNTLHADVQHIDGSGGDGGRDVEFRLTDGLHIYELKSFTGRMTKGRRSQVWNSLKKASGHNPVSWVLAVPIDPTPDEDEWFSGLQSRVDFPIVWRGLTWLDGLMTENPAVVRYFLEETAQEVVDLMTQWKAEQAALANGIPDAVARLEALRDRMNEINPYYAFNITLSHETATVEVVPRYKGAEQEQPITVQLEGNFPDTEEGRAAGVGLADSISYGSSVIVPAEFVERLVVDAPSGLGGVFTKVEVNLTAVGDDTWQLDTTLVVLGYGNDVIASMPMRFDRRTAGVRGGIMYGHSPLDVIELRVQIDSSTNTGAMNLRYRLPGDMLPSAAVPFLRFMHALGAGGALELRIGGVATGRMDSKAAGAALVDRPFLEVVEALARIQDGTSTFFPLPDELSEEDVQAILRTDRLLAGDVLRFEWTGFALGLRALNADTLKTLLEREECALQVLEWSRVEIVAGHQIDLGPVRHTFPAARIEDFDQLMQLLPDREGDDFQLRAVPGASNIGELRRGTGEEDPTEQAE